MGARKFWSVVGVRKTCASHQGIFMLAQRLLRGKHSTSSTLHLIIDLALAWATGQVIRAIHRFQRADPREGRRSSVTEYVCIATSEIAFLL